MLDEINFHVKRGEDFGFETTLSGRSYLSLIRRLKKRGYKMHFFFLVVPNADFSVARVEGRVAQGGHDIPEDVIRRRFDRSIHNFLTHYRHLADSWILFDNSGATPSIVAFEEQSVLGIMDQGIYEELIARYEKP